MFLHKAQALRATAQPRAWHPLRKVTTLSVDDTDQAASRRHNSSYTGIRASLQADQPGAEQGGRLTLCPPPAMQQKSGLGPKLEGSANSSVPETGSQQHVLRVKLPMRPKTGALSHETASFAQPTNPVASPSTLQRLRSSWGRSHTAPASSHPPSLEQLLLYHFALLALPQIDLNSNFCTFTTQTSPALECATPNLFPKLLRYSKTTSAHSPEDSATCPTLEAFSGPTVSLPGPGLDSQTTHRDLYSCPHRPLL